jgi:DNA-directed RNA polymerase subunit RPC12/RpoP
MASAASGYTDLHWKKFCVVCSTDNKWIKKVRFQSEDDKLLSRYLNVFVINYYICGNCSRKLIHLCKQQDDMVVRCGRIVNMMQRNELTPSKLPFPKILVHRNVPVASTPITPSRIPVSVPVALNPVSPSRIPVLVPYTSTPSRIPVSVSKKRITTPDSNSYSLTKRTGPSPLTKRTKQSVSPAVGNYDLNNIIMK